MKIQERNQLIEKAKTRKDGVYSYHGFLYIVKNNNFIAYATPIGNCFACIGVFDALIGTVKSYNRKKELLKYLKKIS